VEVEFMPTNLSIDDDLLRLALEIGKLRTKKATVNQALKEFIEKRKQKEIIQLFGKFDPDPDYDYKSGR
jgi:Arc/MetJ family transcription regulator